MSCSFSPAPFNDCTHRWHLGLGHPFAVSGSCCQHPAVIRGCAVGESTACAGSPCSPSWDNAGPWYIYIYIYFYFYSPLLFSGWSHKFSFSKCCECNDFSENHCVERWWNPDVCDCHEWVVLSNQPLALSKTQRFPDSLAGTPWLHTRPSGMVWAVFQAFTLKDLLGINLILTGGWKGRNVTEQDCCAAVRPIVWVIHQYLKRSCWHLWKVSCSWSGRGGYWDFEGFCLVLHTYFLICCM